MLSRRPVPNFFSGNAPVAPLTELVKAESAESVHTEKKRQVLKKILETREDFLFPFNEDNMILNHWLAGSEAAEHAKTLQAFGSDLTGILSKSKSFETYKLAIQGENPVNNGRYNSHALKGLRLYRDTSHLGELLDCSPALLDFLYENLCQKDLFQQIQQAYQSHLLKLSSSLVLNNLFLYLDKNKYKMIHPQVWNSTAHMQLSLQNPEDRSFEATPNEYEESLNILLKRNLPFGYEALKMQIMTQRIINASQVQTYNEDKQDEERWIMLQVAKLKNSITPADLIKPQDTPYQHAKIRR